MNLTVSVRGLIDLMLIVKSLETLKSGLWGEGKRRYRFVRGSFQRYDRVSTLELRTVSTRQYSSRQPQPKHSPSGLGVCPVCSLFKRQPNLIEATEL